MAHGSWIYVMHVVIANLRWRGKRSRHSRFMRIPQFYVYCKWPIQPPAEYDTKSHKVYMVSSILMHLSACGQIEILVQLIRPLTRQRTVWCCSLYETPHSSPMVAIFGVFSSTWWRHQMETFSALLDICAGNSPVAGEFPAQSPVTRSFDALFDLRLKNGWANNRQAGDLRRYRGHYGVTVMKPLIQVIP